ncbi:uncharacterized protein KY384_006636 [Bacidia gigantensis]|uniref:uncharacterized protein n=1 Tax=Bacidia gigantensis TaxID=2732470 RepID=UPI001D04AA1F|nr:uncharacterized protein KY384_006636 [Bacidia gigantensis]KAG8528947.1 hypothetical protein KY384_006636 [Bacidia gigantensis]
MHNSTPLLLFTALLPLISAQTTTLVTPVPIQFYDYPSPTQDFNDTSLSPDHKLLSDMRSFRAAHRTESEYSLVTAFFATQTAIPSRSLQRAEQSYARELATGNTNAVAPIVTVLPESLRSWASSYYAAYASVYVGDLGSETASNKAILDSASSRASSRSAERATRTRTRTGEGEEASASANATSVTVSSSGSSASGTAGTVSVAATTTTASESTSASASSSTSAAATGGAEGVVVGKWCLAGLGGVMGAMMVL